LGDLQHLLNQSQVSAEILLERIPKSSILKKQAEDIQNQFAACGGDDYEICFTAPVAQRHVIEAISKDLNLPITRIGQTIEMNNSQATVRLFKTDGSLIGDTEAATYLKSFDHFAS